VEARDDVDILHSIRLASWCRDRKDEVTLPDIKLPLFVQEQAEKIKNKLR
jgi:hypothetical protein